MEGAYRKTDESGTCYYEGEEAYRSSTWIPIVSLSLCCYISFIPTSQVTPHVSSISDFPYGQIYLLEHDFPGYSELSSPLSCNPCLVIMYSCGNLPCYLCWNLNLVPLFIISWFCILSSQLDCKFLQGNLPCTSQNLSWKKHCSGLQESEF